MFIFHLKVRDNVSNIIIINTQSHIHGFISSLEIKGNKNPKQSLATTAKSILEKYRFIDIDNSFSIRSISLVPSSCFHDGVSCMI